MTRADTGTASLFGSGAGEAEGTVSIGCGELASVKPLAGISPMDIVVTMGCRVLCPSLPCKHREDWGRTIRPARVIMNFWRSFTVLNRKFS